MSTVIGILLESTGSRLCTSTSEVLSREIECCGGGSSVCSKRVSVAGLPLPSCLFNDRRLIPGHSVFRDRIHYGAKVLELVELIPLDAYATRRKRSIGGCYAT